MRLPQGDHDGELPREQIIATLSRFDVIKGTIAEGGLILEVENPESTLLNPEVIFLPKVVHRDMVKALQRKTGIPLVYFYFPDADCDQGPPGDAH